MPHEMGGSNATERFAKEAQRSSPNKPLSGEVTTDSVLGFFEYPEPVDGKIQPQPFGELALKIVRNTPRNAERTVALRKLLEASDAAKRAGFVIEDPAKE